MIRHTVVFKIKPAISEAAIQTAFKLLFELKTKVYGINKITGGKCHFHEGKGAENFSHGFSIDFADEEAYENFMTSEFTFPFKRFLMNLVEYEGDGIFAFDIGRTNYSGHSHGPKYRIQAPRLRLVPPGSIY